MTRRGLACPVLCLAGYRVIRAGAHGTGREGRDDT
jgi:hypothetical protein